VYIYIMIFDDGDSICFNGFFMILMCLLDLFGL